MATDIYANDSDTLTLPPGQVLTVVADAFGAGIIRRINPNSQLSGARQTSIAANGTKSFGPFASVRTYSIECSRGKLSVDQGKSDYRPAREIGAIETFSASFTLQADMMGTVFRNDSASNLTVTVPNDLPEGFNCGFIKYAAGNVALSFAAGAINRSAVATLTTQYTRGSLFVAKQSANVDAAECLVGGDFV